MAALALVTLVQGKRQLRVDNADSDADVQEKIEQASAIVVRYLKAQAVAGWLTTPPTVDVPLDVQAAVLVVLDDLYERRPIQWDVVNGLLVGIRDPAVA